MDEALEVRSGSEEKCGKGWDVYPVFRSTERTGIAGRGCWISRHIEYRFLHLGCLEQSSDRDENTWRGIHNIKYQLPAMNELLPASLWTHCCIWMNAPPSGSRPAQQSLGALCLMEVGRNMCAVNKYEHDQDFAQFDGPPSIEPCLHVHRTAPTRLRGGRRPRREGMTSKSTTLNDSSRRYSNLSP